MSDRAYRDAESDEEGITIINLSPHGQVDIRENAVPYDLDRETAKATADTPMAPPNSNASVTLDRL